MKLWLAVPFLALAQADCYDYEYYDPDTGAPIAGNACNKPAVGTTVGQPSAFPAQSAGVVFPPAAGTTLPSASGLVVPSTQTYATGLIAPQTGVLASQPYTTGLVAPTYGQPIVQPASIYGPSTTIVSSTPVYGPAQVAPTVVYGASAGPSQVVVGPSASRAAASAQASSQLAELEYYKRLGERQQRQHRQNQRTVTDASRISSRASLFNRIVAGPNAVTPLFPAIRLSQQKRVAEAYRSEKQIANRNAQDAYQRYQEDPTRLNLLVSRYQDLNADLRDAAYQYNVVNSATFGQRVVNSGILNLGGGIFGGLSQILVQRRQSNDLQDIQRQMQRVARQIQQEAQNAVGGAQASQQAQQGSVQQRLMASTVYGPARGR